MALEIDVSGVVDFIAGYLESLPGRMAIGAAVVAEQMESYAKQNAPWTDRTGNARRTLSGFVVSDDAGSLLIGVAGHMPYSPKLELFYGGRYSILAPTVDVYAPTILSAAVSAAMSFGRNGS